MKTPIVLMPRIKIPSIIRNWKIFRKSSSSIECKCLCGKQSIEKCLKSHSTLELPDCDCEENIKLRKKGFDRLYYLYTHRAKKGDLTFTLTKKHFRKLVEDNCFYCGSPPAQKITRNVKQISYNYNGIDRIDSNKGYTKENTLTCCKACNMMKHTKKFDDFVAHIHKISDHLKP